MKRTKIAYQKTNKRAFVISCLFALCAFSYGESIDIIPRLYLSSRNKPVGTEPWFFQQATWNNTNTNDYIKMIYPESCIELKEFCDFSDFENITMTVHAATLGTFDMNQSNATMEICYSEEWINIGYTSFIQGQTTSTPFSFPIPQCDSAKLRIKTPNSLGNAGVRIFSIQITGSRKKITSPLALPASDITTHSFIAHWENSPKATCYKLSAYEQPLKKMRKVLDESFTSVPNSTRVLSVDELNACLPYWKGENIRSDHDGAFVKIGGATENGYLTTPVFDLSSNGGKFSLSFTIKGALTTKPSIEILLNNVVVKNLDNISNSESAIYTLELSGGTQATLVTLKTKSKKGDAFLLYDMAIEQIQDCDIVYLSGFPKDVAETSYLVEGLSPNTNYLYQITAKNEAETSAPSNIISIKTTGNNKTVNSDEDVTYTEDIDGDLHLYSGAIVRGNIVVKGEVAYIRNFTPGVWESVSLPFEPKKVGAYKNGIGYILRENIDYSLQQYTDRQFVNATLKKDGYIIKLPTVFDYDNNTLYFFSKKETRLNEPVSPITPKSEFMHHGNPYSYPVKPSELVNASLFYTFKEGKYVLGNEEVLPFQSFISYNGKFIQNAPQEIIPESYSGTAQPKVSLLVYQEGQELVVKAENQMVEIYSPQGKLLYKEFVEREKHFAVIQGLYLIRTSAQVIKIWID